MWSCIQPNHSGPSGSFLAGQKREFSIHYGKNLSVSSEKSFQNPNFLNNHPHIQNSVLVMENCPIDIDNKVVDQSSTRNDFLINSSQSILDNLKKNQMDTVRNRTPRFKVNDKKRARSYRRKAPIKNSNKTDQRQIIHNMMEIDNDHQVYMNASDTQMSPKERQILNLADFLVGVSCQPSDNESTSDGEDPPTVISISPNDCQLFVRERQLSTDSEDSFVVFETGTDDELEFSEDEDEESEGETYSEVDDDFSSSSSVIPCKRVRFAAKEELCQIHPMIQWSFAYRKARKGPWEEYARDRCRFGKKIGEIEKTLAPIFDCKHRERIYKERFQDERTD